eukprot:8930096-Heterocapsa_arctica.AAC.1
MKKLPFNFFAVLEISKITYVDDVADVTALRLYLECGNDHYALYFYQIKRQMDGQRGMTEDILDTISVRTKAAIIYSILGLGYIFKHKGYEELKDMPDIINDMEKYLRNFQPENFKHKNR